MYNFTNRFSQSDLRSRIGMMNRPRSKGWILWRYGVLCLLLGIVILACQQATIEESTDHKVYITNHRLKLPLTNATRTLAAELDKEGVPWYRQSALISEQKPDTLTFSHLRYPEILCLRDNKLALKLPLGKQAKVYINGQETVSAGLSRLSFEEVEDLLIYEKWDDAAGAETYPEDFRVFISTTHTAPKMTPTRYNWKYYLQAAAVSEHPLGASNTFSMNKLLEATFFSNKSAFVRLTKSDHLQLYDDYTRSIDLYINGIAAKPSDIETVHVREVDKLYTMERPFLEWMTPNSSNNRYVLYIETAPKRAKRDSSYYVFSPFYSGDF